MHIHAAEPLFAWGELEDHPTLGTIRAFLEAVPDEELLARLQAARGTGRHDYPIVCLGRVVLLTIALRHVSFNAWLAELPRNLALCRLRDITSADEIPPGWNLSRFLDVLGQEPPQTALRQVFDARARRLGTAVPDLGRHPAGDATALAGRATTGPKAVRAEQKQGLPQPRGGKKEYLDDEGRGTKVYEWFEPAPIRRWPPPSGAGLRHHRSQGRGQRARPGARGAGHGEPAGPTDPDPGLRPGSR